MKLTCQKDLFQFTDDLHYLNCAYKSPLLKRAEEAAIVALQRGRNPNRISPAVFFSESKLVRAEYASMIGATANNIAIVPSSSYGFATLFNTIQGKTDGHAITIGDEFPSGFLALKKWCTQENQKLITIKQDSELIQSGRDWNDRILAAINKSTTVVCMSAIHWSTGLKYDLEAIGAKSKSVGAKLFIDGAQTIGALPVDVRKCQIDGLVCAAYKCLYGPYSMSLLYVHEDLFDGEPLEEAWMNREGAEDFSSLSDYNENYSEGAGRYNMGQTSNFILTPILLEGLKQVNQWGVSNIQAYCQELAMPFIARMKELGYQFEEEPYLCFHLFSIKIGYENVDRMKAIMIEKKLKLSIRGAYLRISLSVFNTSQDLVVLGEALEQLKTKSS